MNLMYSKKTKNLNWYKEEKRKYMYTTNIQKKWVKQNIAKQPRKE